jgi:hypothetical protein
MSDERIKHLEMALQNIRGECKLRLKGSTEDSLAWILEVAEAALVDGEGRADG